MDEEIKQDIAVNASASMFESLSVVGALAERRIINPAKVAAWAKIYAEGLEKDTRDSADPKHLKAVAAKLRDFAVLIEKGNVKPPEVGTA